MAILEWDLVFYPLTSNKKQSLNWLAVHTQKEEEATQCKGQEFWLAQLGLLLSMPH